MNFKQWFIEVELAQVEDIPEAIEKTISYLLSGSWSRYKERKYKTDPDFSGIAARGHVQMIGRGVKTPSDVFRASVRYIMRGSQFKQQSYDPRRGDPDLIFLLSLTGWKPGIDSINPYGIGAHPQIDGKPLSVITDRGTGMTADDIRVHTPYEIVKAIQKWVDVLYDQDDDNFDSWQDEPDPTDPRELVPVPVPKPRQQS